MLVPCLLLKALSEFLREISSNGSTFSASPIFILPKLYFDRFCFVAMTANIERLFGSAKLFLKFFILLIFIYICRAMMELLEMMLTEDELKELARHIQEEKRKSYALGTKTAVDRLRKQGFFEVRRIIERASSFEELKHEAETEYLQNLPNPYTHARLF